MKLINQIREYFSNNSLRKSDFIKNLSSLRNIEEIGKGLANINFLLTFNDNRKLLMRFNFWKDKDWYTGNIINIENEYEVLKHLEKYKISPKVYFLDTSKEFFPYDFLLEEYIEHDNIQVDSDFIGIVKTIKKLHKIKPTFKTKKIINIDATKEQKIVLYEQRLGSVYKNKANEIEKIFFQNKNIYKSYLETIGDTFSGESIVHHDPFPENLLYKKSWYLIDWQTTVIGNPIHDVAYLLMDFIYQFTIGRKLTKKEKEIILKNYYETDNIVNLKEQAERLLPLYYIDLFLFLLYKEGELKKQKFPKELNSFLEERLKHSREIILKKQEILFWFNEMKKRLPKQKV